MKNATIIAMGTALNIFVYLYAKRTERDLGTLVPKMYLFFILPLAVMLILIASAIYRHRKHQKKVDIVPTLLIAFFLLLVAMQFFFFSNGVIAR